MKFPRIHSLSEIAGLLDCTYIGEPDFQIKGINEIHVVEPGDIVFVDHPKYYDKALASAATTVLINKEVECPEGFKYWPEYNQCRRITYTINPVPAPIPEPTPVPPTPIPPFVNPAFEAVALDMTEDVRNLRMRLN